MQLNRILVQEPEILTSHNLATLDAYNDDPEGYLNNTPSHFGPEHEPLTRWIRRALSYIPIEGRVLEIGSGSGRDASFIEKLGYKITRSDGAIAFVERLRTNGYRALHLNLLVDSLPNSHDMIFANAVIPHFTQEETVFAFEKMFSSLPPGGIVAVNAKQGVGSSWTSEKLKGKRYIHYWQPADLCSVAERVGFEILYLVEGLQGDLETHTWIHTIMRKKD